MLVIMLFCFHKNHSAFLFPVFTVANLLGCWWHCYKKDIEVMSIYFTLLTFSNKINKINSLATKTFSNANLAYLPQSTFKDLLITTSQ